MTKAEIVDSVYERVGGFSKKEAAEVVEAVFETLKDAIVREAEEISIDDVVKAAEALQRAEETKAKSDNRVANELRASLVHTAVKISGFGNFTVRGKPQRQGRNPQTDEPIPISARRVVSFKPSQVLKGVLNPTRMDVDHGDSVVAVSASRDRVG